MTTDRASADGIVVVGNVCWDVVVGGLPDLPRWGEEAEGDDSRQAPGGQAYNMVAALGGLGRPSALVAVVGADHAGETILAGARAAGADVTGTLVDGVLPTAVTAALVRTDGERAFASDFGAQRRWGLEQVEDRWPLVRGARILCLAGLLNIPGFPIDDAALLLDRARAEGITTMLDTGWDPLNWPAERREATLALLAHVDVFLPNADEARAITGLDDDGFAAAEALRAAQPDGATVVVKRGGEGSVAIDGAGRRWRAGALDVTVRDAVGAGDTFDAGFVLGLVEGLEFDRALALGTAAAGLRVSGEAGAWPERATADAAAAHVDVVEVTR